MSRVLRFPYPSLEELRAAELAILEDLAETRRRIVDLLEGERGSERKHPRGVLGGPREALGRKPAPSSVSKFRRPS